MTNKLIEEGVLEERYAVIKLKHLSEQQRESLKWFLEDSEITLTDCVVIEQGKPNYDLAVSLCTGVRHMEDHQPTIIEYPVNDVIQHQKSGNVYGVLSGPSDGVRLESTGEPAYVYSPVKKDARGSYVWDWPAIQRGLPKYVRGQSEMEDGRFAQLGAYVEGSL